MPTEKKCGTCEHWQSKGMTSGCYCPIPDSVWTQERYITEAHDATSCPCYQPKEDK